VIAQHGAGSFPELVLARPGGHHDLLREPVKRGWIVYAPLAAMHYPFDNARNPVHGAEVRAVLDGQLRPKGTSLAAVEAARVSGALTALLRRGLASHVAMAGLSFGSVFTLYMMVLDKRIAAGVASCSFRDFFMDGIDPGDPQGRPFDFTAAELARWIAPRPLQVQAGRNDPNLPVERARAAAEKARAYWRGSGGFEFVEFEGGHEFSGPEAWRFLAAQFGPG
jgi:predicted esterase